MIEPLAKPKKSNAKALHKKCDDLFAIVIKARDKVCQRCGKAEFLQCSHFMSRRYWQVCCDLDNANCLCRGCHKYFTEHPIEFEKYLIELMGEDKLVELKQRATAYGQKLDWLAKLDELNLAAQEYNAL